MISLEISKKHVSLSSNEQGLATGAHARSAMMPEFASAIEARTTVTRLSLMISEPTLERMVVKYSEQLIFQPLHELRYWFTYSAGAFLEPGYPPLYYSRGDHRTISPNKSAVSAIGEGVAGFLAQRIFRCSMLARPNHDYPDIVMEGSGMTFLVEAKATLESDEKRIESVIDEELPRLAALTTAAKQLDVRPVRGLLVGTSLTSETEYQCHLIELELV